MDLLNKKCVPCEGGIDPLKPEKVREYLKLVPGWELESGHIVREFKFKNFVEAMAFANKVAKVAEEEGHHPDLQIHYNKVKAELWTHAINGLHENDFVVAAKISAINVSV